MNRKPSDVPSELISPWSETADLAALGAAFTHRLRDPLHAIRLFNGALEQRLPEVAASTREIDRAAQSLASVFRALEEYLCAPPATATWVEAEHLDTIVDDVIARCDGTVAVDRNAGGDGVGGIRLDPESFSRVVHEAVDNAIRHGAGRRSLAWSVVHGVPRLQIWDEGPGIPDSMGHRAFLPLVSDGGRRSGMGLAWVNRFVRQVDGSVCATHEEGRFTLTIDFGSPVGS